MASIQDWLAFLDCAQRLMAQGVKIQLIENPVNLAFKPVIPLPDLLPFQIPEMIELPDFLNGLPDPPKLPPALKGLEMELPIPWPINVTVEPQVLLPLFPKIQGPAYTCPIGDANA